MDYLKLRIYCNHKLVCNIQKNNIPKRTLRLLFIVFHDQSHNKQSGAQVDTRCGLAHTYRTICSIYIISPRIQRVARGLALSTRCNIVRNLPFHYLIIRDLSRKFRIFNLNWTCQMQF